MVSHYIALDVHCGFSEIAVVTERGKLVRRERCETAIPSIVERLSAVRRPRRVTFEEGPLADWLSRELRPHADEVLVCEPRRNHWIARDADKDDPIDAFKLAELYRGGFLKKVHQADSLERSLLKQQVLLYHDRVRDRVRQGHQLVAVCRRHGAFVKAADLRDDAEWKQCLDRLPAGSLLRRAWESGREVYLLMIERERELWTELVGTGRNGPEHRGGAAVRGVAGNRLDPRHDVLRPDRHAASLPRQVGFVAVLRNRPGAASQRQRSGSDAGDAARPSTTQRRVAGRRKVGRRPGRQRLRRQAPGLEGGRTASRERPSQRRAGHRVHNVEPVENRTDVRPAESDFEVIRPIDRR